MRQEFRLSLRTLVGLLYLSVRAFAQEDFANPNPVIGLPAISACDDVRIPIIAASHELLIAAKHDTPLLTGSTPQAQVHSAGQVHGLIQDAGGSAVAGAQVVAHNSRENTDRAFMSAADGSFVMNDLKPGHYQFKATKRGFAASPAAEADLAAGENLPLSLALRTDGRFLKRLSRAYAKDWQGTVASGPEPPRRALPSPLPSPPFPNSDWSYGGSPEIGVPDTNAPPLMQALYAGPNGAAWEQSRVKVYGWLAGSFDLSTSHNSNYPAAYDIFANRTEFDQAVLYAERLPDTVQTDHVDWGFPPAFFPLVSGDAEDREMAERIIRPILVPADIHVTPTRQPRWSYLKGRRWPS